MVNTHPSSRTERYLATVGGTIFDHTEHGLRFRPLAVDEVGAWKVAGRESRGAWPLADIYAEGWAERHPEADAGSPMRTGSLFSEPVEAGKNRDTDKDMGFATRVCGLRHASG